MVDPEISYGSGCKVVGWIKPVQNRVQSRDYYECENALMAVAKAEKILATWQNKSSVPKGIMHIFK